METQSTSVPNDLLEAVLKFKCPAGYKEVIFTTARLIVGYQLKNRAVSVSCIAKFMRQDKSNVARRLRKLIECRVLKETSSPGYHQTRRLAINLNYNEWIPVKRRSVIAETKKRNLFSEKMTTMVNSTTPNVAQSATGIDEAWEDELADLFEKYLGRKPDIDEVYEFRNQVINDAGFSQSENMIILRSAFHRSALIEQGGNHTVYILDIIGFMKQDILKKRDMFLKALETNSAAEQKFTRWRKTGFSLHEDCHGTTDSMPSLLAPMPDARCLRPGLRLKDKDYAPKRFGKQGRRA